MEVIKMSILVFVTQLIFIGCRTWNIRVIAEKNMFKALLSGGIIHISWLISISLGAVSMKEIVTDMNWIYLPVVLCSLTGSLIGSYLGMERKSR